MSDHADRNAELNVLLVEYESLLSDERQYSILLATLLGVGVGLSAFVAAVVVGSDAVPVCKQDASTSSVDGSCDVFRAVAPMVGFILLLVLQVAGSQAVVRSFQLRLVERRLRERLPPAPPGVVPIGAVHTVMLGHTSLSRGAPRYRILTNVLMISVIALVIGLTVWSISRVESGTMQIIAVFVYGLLGGVMLWDYAINFYDGRSVWRDVLARLPPRLTEKPGARTSHRLTRGAWWYLILPRPQDLPKSLIAMAAALLATLVVADPLTLRGLASTLGYVAAAVIVFELLGYHSRYLLNDVGGLSYDLEHHSASDRARLTTVVDAVGARKAVAYALLDVVARLSGLVVVSLAFFSRDTRAILWVGTFLAFAIALPYETLKRRIAAAPAGNGISGVYRGIYLWVGSGYALRAVLGVALTSVSLTAVGYLSFAVTFWVFGIMFVTMTWALEGTSSLGLVGALPPDKGHLLPLTRSALASQGEADHCVDTGDPRSWPLLRNVVDKRVTLIWDRALLVTVLAAAGVFAALLGTDSLFAAAAISIIWLAVAVTSMRASLGQRTSRLLVVGLVSSVAAGLAAGLGARETAVVGLGMMSLVITHIYFRTQSYNQLLAFGRKCGDILSNITRGLRLALRGLVVALVGESTLRLLGEERAKEKRTESATE